MAETFGHKWTSAYGLVPNDAWMDGLADMTVDDIKAGFAHLKTWQDDDGWPPTMLQFRALCRPHAAPAHTAYQALPAPAASMAHRASVAFQHCAALRHGSLKADAPSPRTLSPEDRALLERLDFARIHAAAGDIARLDDLPKPESMAAPITSVGCTCRIEQVERPQPDGSTVRLWERVGPACAYCHDWHARLVQAGVSDQRPAVKPQRGRNTYRKAA